MLHARIYNNSKNYIFTSKHILIPFSNHNPKIDQPNKKYLLPHIF